MKQPKYPSPKLMREQPANGFHAVQGDDNAIPKRGSKTNVKDTYGADVSPAAKNRMGSMAGRCDSHPITHKGMSDAMSNRGMIEKAK